MPLLLCTSFKIWLLILPQMCAGGMKILYFLIFCFQSFVQFSPEVKCDSESSCLIAEKSVMHCSS